MQDDAQKPIAQNVLAFALDQTLRMLHPFIPFITEGIFGNLNQIAPVRKLKGLADAGTSEALIVADWPAVVERFIDEVAEGQISVVQNVIRSIRDIRSKYNIAPSKKLDASAIAPKETAEVLNESAALIKTLGGIEGFSVGVDLEKVEDAAAAVVGDVQLYVHGVIDKEAEKGRLEKQKQQIENGIKPLQGKLGNENFVTRAKPEVVAQAKQRLKELTEQLEAVDKLLAELGD
jgi:valyl-tRNA synthetase